MGNPLHSFFNNVLRESFPKLRCAFAYGSAVFHQHQQQKGKMLDLMLVVDDAELWHNENLMRNPHHYSFLRHLGSEVIAHVQRSGGRVYYNTLVNIDSQILKYGVICMEDLLDDLENWKWLYVSGRLQKPVIFLSDLNEEPSLHQALKMNLSSAACCAVLLIGSSGVPFTALEFFNVVAGLSYRGDFRTFIGEDKKKVNNIARGSFTDFKDLYSPYLSKLVDFLPDNTMTKKASISIESCECHLPEAIKQNLLHGESLQGALASVVRRSSVQQSVKGILTAGSSPVVPHYPLLTFGCTKYPGISQDRPQLSLTTHCSLSDILSIPGYPRIVPSVKFTG